MKIFRKDSSKWPIARLAKVSAEFLEEVEKYTLAQFYKTHDTYEKRVQKLKATATREVSRITNEPYNIDPKDDKIFWTKIKERFDEGSDYTEEDLKALYQDIIKRYVKEIHQKFNPKVSDISRYILYNFIILFVIPFKKFVFRKKLAISLKESLKFIGHYDHIEKLTKKGTLVFLPNHQSHYDSIFVGAMSYFKRMPDLLYGAGLNLFQSSFFSFFMRKIGTYTIDRRKLNHLYVESLKSYYNHTIRFGCHTIFYPGGGRMRNGKIETTLKKGLLSTVVEAQLLSVNPKTKEGQKIFIVPVNLTMTSIPEAPTLIREHLQSNKPKTKYSFFSNALRKLAQVKKFIYTRTLVSVNVEKPIDILGRSIDLDGNPRDENGNKVDFFAPIIELKKKGSDKKHLNEILSNIEKLILEKYKKNNIILSAHVVAYVCFRMIKMKYPDLEDQEFWDINPNDISLDFEEVKSSISKVVQSLIDHKNQFVLDPDINNLSKDEYIKRMIEILGAIHEKRPLILKENCNIGTQDLLVLYYYHNKIDDYEIEKPI